MKLIKIVSNNNGTASATLDKKLVDIREEDGKFILEAYAIIIGNVDAEKMYLAYSASNTVIEINQGQSQIVEAIVATFNDPRWPSG